MDEAALVETLRDIDFLDGIKQEYLEKIASVSRLVTFEKDKLIFREGDPATNVFLITEGSVSLQICAPGVGCRRVLTLGPGELLGWSPVLEQTRLTATARTLATTQAVEISGRQIIALCQHYPPFGYEFMRRAALAMAKRLSAARLQLIDVYGSETSRMVDSGGD